MRLSRHNCVIVLLLAVLMPQDLRAQRPSPIDLMTKAVLPADAVQGRWGRSAKGLESTSGTQRAPAKLNFPVDLPESYDFTVTFRITGNDPNVAQIISRGQASFVWNMGARNSGFGLVDGRPSGRNRSTINAKITSGKSHTSMVKVRPSSVSAYLDGVLVSRMETNYSDVSLAAMWSLNKPGAIGIGADQPIVVSSAVLVANSDEAASGPAIVQLRPGYPGLAMLLANTRFESTNFLFGDTEKVRADLKQLASDEQPTVAKAAQLVLDGVDRSLARERQTSTDSDQFYSNILEAMRRNEYADSIGPDPKTDIGSASILATRSLNAFVEPRAEPLRNRLRFDLEQARIAVWNELIPKLADFYPESVEQQGLIELKMTPPEVATGGKPAFVAINISGKALTDVTLVLDLVHARTAPAVTTRAVYFIPQWDANWEIPLPLACLPNQASPELIERRYALLDPSQSLLNANSWLSDVGGVMSINLKCWATEAHQPDRVEQLKTNAEAVARWELTLAQQLAASHLRNPTGRGSTAMARVAALPPATGNIPQDHPSLNAARRITKYLPEDSPIAAEAKAFIDSPVAATQKAARQQLEQLMAALDANTRRKGEWLVPPPFVMPTSMPASSVRGTNRTGDKLGESVLTITSRSSDGARITATWGPPNTGQQLNGFITVDPQSNRIVAYFESPPPAARRGRAASAQPAGLSTGNIWLKLVPQENGLFGLIGLAGQPGENPIRFGPAEKVAPAAR